MTHNKSLLDIPESKMPMFDFESDMSISESDLPHYSRVRMNYIVKVNLKLMLNFNFILKCRS